jgi:hypothetical protein
MIIGVTFSNSLLCSFSKNEISMLLAINDDDDDDSLY